MLHYTLKRLYSAIAVVLVISAITFLMLTVISGNSAMLQLGTDATEEQLAELEHELGLDLPWYQQYAKWIWGILHLDFGTSSLYGESVLTLVIQRLPVTLSISIFAMLMASVVSFVLGIASAVYKDSILDVICRSFMQIGTAVPGFWIGIIFIVTIALNSSVFPVFGFVSPSESISGWLASIFLPSLVLAIGETGTLLRSVRTSMLQSLQQDYIMMAKVQGLSPWKVYVKFGLRGAIATPLNVAGLKLARLLGGTTIVESVFSLPGLGRLVLIAVEQRDTTLLQGTVMFITTAVVLISLIVDLITALMNPKMRLSGGDSE